jgi:hypothetical protein
MFLYPTHNISAARTMNNVIDRIKLYICFMYSLIVSYNAVNIAITCTVSSGWMISK